MNIDDEKPRTCSKLVCDGSNILGQKVDINRYFHLHIDGKRLVNKWFMRAWEKRDSKAENCFEPFIYAWIALNGWAACISGLDQDSQWKDALSQCKKICKDFEKLVADKNSALSAYAFEFSELWPIFRVQEIRSKLGRFMVSSNSNRNEMVEYYINKGIAKFEPQCWVSHHEEGTQPPVDWPHTLAALYRVRCNLFHGEKAPHSEMDQSIVRSALLVLIYFFDSTGYLKGDKYYERDQAMDS